ncbi:DMT family transporter [Vibrio sp. JPW-9-11-11]|uniref:DMT family transporter n=1 Tax=Vibrio sp. JPW-9-11-11 TaxID=1416532 RepID=UPI001593BAF0|nr:DMT family transporter [Vibrio sp. JPW-9-11-11]NVD08841.1 DMT family transporter [Vibrio sp. JPW-9-11-11]
MPYQGEIAAVGAAFVWAVATWLYSQFSHRFSALQLNIVKGVVASVMMLLLLPFSPASELTLSWQHLAILAFSGVLGIAVGDSAYFASLKRIGPNKTLLLESLAPPLSGVLALVILGSVLPAQSWIGVVVTTLAVSMVVFHNDGQAVSGAGVSFGLLASVCQASGVVISHYALVAGDIAPLFGALIRLIAGVVALMMVIGFFEREPFTVMRQNLCTLGRHNFGWLMAAIFVGTFLALWLQQVALKYANPAVAQTLIATSPLFMLAIYAVKGQRVTRRAFLGTLLALVGISLFFIR